ncbi:MAG: hypothetical protein COB66_08600 [Coxiella sp. (in: Bacteria)]|nr:MAG: hypothetical protein COB66_08600 [Coxiella sp. (in: g-proteobacteria)]
MSRGLNGEVGNNVRRLVSGTGLFEAVPKEHAMVIDFGLLVTWTWSHSEGARRYELNQNFVQQLLAVDGGVVYIIYTAAQHVEFPAEFLGLCKETLQARSAHRISSDDDARSFHSGVKGACSHVLLIYGDDPYTFLEVDERLCPAYKAGGFDAGDIAEIFQRHSALSVEQRDVPIEVYLDVDDTAMRNGPSHEQKLLVMNDCVGEMTPILKSIVRSLIETIVISKPRYCSQRSLAPHSWHEYNFH